MINWKKLGELIRLKELLFRLYEVLDLEEDIKYTPIIQLFSDRLHDHIRKVYRQYEANVINEEREKSEL